VQRACVRLRRNLCLSSRYFVWTHKVATFRKARRLRHRPDPETPPPYWHALLSPLVTYTFDELRVSTALWVSGDWWEPIHVVPGVADFEQEHEVQSKRWAYNRRTLASVVRKGTVVRAEHAGFHDLFVPVTDESGVRAVLVVGPYATRRPTSTELLQRWFSLSGTHARFADPNFQHYVSVTLSTLTLEGNLPDTLQALVECFSALMSSRGSGEAQYTEAYEHRTKLMTARNADQMWEGVRSMLGERTSHTWSSPDRWRERLGLGIRKLPAHVVVGLLFGERDELDPVDELLRRDAFQRACVALARKLGDVVCGPVGDHGVVFLVDFTGSPARTRARLTELATRAAHTARRFGFKLRAGIHPGNDHATLLARYRSALVAAELAVSRGQASAFAEERATHSRKDVRRLCTRLGQSSAERAQELAPRFDQYAEAVLLHHGYRFEPVRAELDAGIERMAEPLLAAGALDEKSFDDLRSKLGLAITHISSVTELVALYRSLVVDVRDAVKSPTLARQARGTRRAVAFMREHSGEPLTLSQVARAAGFAPDYFSRLFSRTEGTTFERYLQKLRVEKAKHMLTETDLAIEGVSRLSGFSDRAYFHRVFKANTGVTPAQFREARPRY
jgi:AraC-like DNA-binding protein